MIQMDSPESKFFARIGPVDIPTLQEMSAALSVGLRGSSLAAKCDSHRGFVAKIKRFVGLGPREFSGGDPFQRFLANVERFAGSFIDVWKRARSQESFQSVPKAVDAFLGQIRTSDIADEDYPLVHARRGVENSFTYVRLLRSLAVLCAGREGAADFLDLLVSNKPKPADCLNHTALAQVLLEQGQYRKAADSALEAKRLRSNDLCVSKTVYATQKALFDAGQDTDFDLLFGDNTNRFCDMPFMMLNIFSRSSKDTLAFGLCQCRGWMSLVFDFEKEFSWNSAESQEVRRSILDGSFRYCNELRCPYMLNDTLPRREDVADPYLRRIIDKNLTELPKGPKKLWLAYDRSCNLSCPSCRRRVFVEGPAKTQSLNEMMDSILPPVLADVNRLQISQVGEALASAHYRRLLKTISPSTHPSLTISLMTNLKLVSEETWRAIGPAADCIKTIVASIDGATPATLEKLRRGITWERMTDAMEFVAGLRRSSRLVSLNVTFVVQRDNFRELSQMLEMCSRYSVDHIALARISSHGSYTNEQFKDVDVGDPSHPLHSEYRDAIAGVKALRERMLDGEEDILAKGRSVPSLAILA
ncbi:MAG: hypothetical protein HN350_08340 [Phycisphaerales bacterium]|nr:hypothetical protein [Phycisphaerales bacterium]